MVHPDVRFRKLLLIRDAIILIKVQTVRSDAENSRPSACFDSDWHKLWNITAYFIIWTGIMFQILEFDLII